MLGDNSSVITSSTIPSLALKKCHQALSYHYVHACVVHGFLKFCFLKSEQNVADTCTKFYFLCILALNSTNIVLERQYFVWCELTVPTRGVITLMIFWIIM